MQVALDTEWTKQSPAILLGGQTVKSKQREYNITEW